MGLVLILLASFESTASVFDAVKWSLIMIALSILPIYLASVYLVRKKRLDRVFTNVRPQRTRLYVLAAILAIAGSLLLFYLEAPFMLRALFVAGASAALMFVCINLWWKISLHAAFAGVSVVILVVLYGLIACASIVLVPLVVWARIELEYHSVAQGVAGALLGVSNMVAVFYLFGLV